VPPSGSLGFILDGDSNTETHEETPELDRLLQYLNIGNIESLIAMIEIPYFQSRILTWLDRLDTSYWSNLERGTLSVMPQQQFTIPQALIFELMPLPTCLEDLFEEALRRPCESCGTSNELIYAVPNNPAMCLLCGMFVCAQSMCCTDGDKGEANSHIAE
jgi:hypothetical protein